MLIGGFDSGNGKSVDLNNTDGVAVNDQRGLDRSNNSNMGVATASCAFSVGKPSTVSMVLNKLSVVYRVDMRLPPSRV